MVAKTDFLLRVLRYSDQSLVHVQLLQVDGAVRQGLLTGKMSEPALAYLLEFWQSLGKKVEIEERTLPGGQP